MILTVKGPINSSNATIRVNDVVRLETCLLEFFGKKLFNLYIIVKTKAGEHFHLFSYTKHDDFHKAYVSIAEVLKERPNSVSTIEVSPPTLPSALTNFR